MVGGEFGYLDRGAGPAKRKRTIRRLDANKTCNTCARIGSIGREVRSSECVRGLYSYEHVLGSSWKTSYAETSAEPFPW
jgi:hypothetical protein